VHQLNRSSDIRLDIILQTQTMAPDRTHPHRKNAKAGPSTSHTGPKALPYDKRDGSGVPGVSKLKASIRQTKRFLAKVRDVYEILLGLS
jgi:hypothetical protein